MLSKGNIMRELSKTEISSVNGAGIVDDFKQFISDVWESFLENFIGEKPSDG